MPTSKKAENHSNWQSLNKMLFSQGAANVISALAPTGRPSGSAHFPWVTGWTDENARVKVTHTERFNLNEILRGWFRDLIGNSNNPEVRIEQCQIESRIENRISTEPVAGMACVAAVAWNAGVLDFCRMQVLVTHRGDLLDFYLGQNPEVTAQYYRLELDARQPGPLFTHPQPHVHSVPDGPPMFAFNSPSDEYLPISFLEFIYLNHFAVEWRSWAEAVCRRNKPDLPFANLVEHYNKGEILGVLPKFESHIAELKLILGAEKRMAVNDAPKLSPTLSTLNYWS